MSGGAWLLVGFCLGAALGGLIMALMMMAGATDRELERETADGENKDGSDGGV